MTDREIDLDSIATEGPLIRYRVKFSGGPIRQVLANCSDSTRAEIITKEDAAAPVFRIVYATTNAGNELAVTCSRAKQNTTFTALPIVRPQSPYSIYEPSLRACTASLSITLGGFGKDLAVELRRGVPGNSISIETAKSNGQNIIFGGLCGDKYFLAIGNDRTVSITPAQDIKDKIDYIGTITTHQGGGNIRNIQRDSL